MIHQFNNVITMNRGDTYQFRLDITDDGEEYELTGDDALYLGIMDPGQPFENALVKKKLVVDNYYNDSGVVYGSNITFVILPEDTIDLVPGKYYYAVKLKMNHTIVNPDTGEEIPFEKICTIINNTKFIILE